MIKQANGSNKDHGRSTEWKSSISIISDTANEFYVNSVVVGRFVSYSERGKDTKVLSIGAQHFDSGTSKTLVDLQRTGILFVSYCIWWWWWW